MKFKQKAIEDTIYTNDLYYDIFDGGYIDPTSMLEYEEDINRVNQAISTIEDFIEQALNQGALREV